jgi:hypothetical protein
MADENNEYYAQKAHLADSKAETQKKDCAQDR